MVSPKISVVIPSYNQGAYLEQTLCSVIDQSYSNLELIVIDGGSTDASLEIIRRYEEKMAYWVSEPDDGQTDALVKGFNKSTGDIQCWLNSDDLHEPGTLKKVAEYFSIHPNVEAVFGSTVWIDAENNPLRVHHEIPFSRFIWLYTHNYIPGMSMFWRRSIYERSGGLDPDFDLAMDADLWFRFSKLGKIGHVRQIWSRMRFYPEQKMRRLREASDSEELVIRSREWGTEHPPFLDTKRTLAHLMRITWKLITGCYPLGYRRYMEKTEV